ncbi:hypothetical protein DH86_00003874, partial [Scytalidium sp. 3C]
VIGELAGSISDIQSSSTTYFNTVHKWMPIVSKRQFYATLLHRMTTRRAELLLLTLSMKLSSSNVEVAETDLYRAVKQLHFEAESCGTLSILVLQAGVIIALYELGHAIYPAAYLSVGRCARYAIGLGLDQTASTVGEMKLPWNEEEECRRVWWSILILDRFLNLCGFGQRLLTPDIHSDIYLPVDEEAWDAGLTRPEDAFRLGSASVLHMGLFARLAQAAHLVSKALQDARDGETDTAQLRRTLFALISLSEMEGTAVTHLRIHRKDHSQSTTDKLNLLNQGLRQLNTRWLAGSTYLSLLETREMMALIPYEFSDVASGY